MKKRILSALLVLVLSVAPLYQSYAGEFSTTESTQKTDSENTEQMQFTTNILEESEGEEQTAAPAEGENTASDTSENPVTEPENMEKKPEEDTEPLAETAETSDEVQEVEVIETEEEQASQEDSDTIVTEVTNPEAVKEAVDGSITTNYLSENLNVEKATEAESSSVEAETTDVSEAGTTTVKEEDENELTETIHQIKVNMTIADTEAKKYDNIDDLYSKGLQNIYSNFIEYVPVFEKKGMDDAYVAFVDFGKMNHSTQEVFHCEFVTGDELDPVIADDVVYDKDTGIVYIPKYHYFNQDGEETAYDLQAHVVSLVDLEENRSSFTVTVENDVENAENMIGVANIETGSFDTTTTIPLMDAEDADKIDLSDIEVILNDKEDEFELIENETAFYDQKTGELLLRESPLTIYSIKIKINEKSFWDKLSGIFTIKTNAGADYADSAAGMAFTYPIQPISASAVSSLTVGCRYTYKAKVIKGSVKTSKISDIYNETANYVYAPAAREYGTNSENVRNYFYNSIRDGKSLAKIISGVKSLKDNTGKKYKFGNLYCESGRYWAKFSTTPPKGTATRVGSKGPASFDFSVINWNRTNSKFTNEKKAQISAYCAHPKDPIAKRGSDTIYSDCKYYISILDKSSTYMVIGLVSASVGGGGGQACATSVKLPLQNKAPVNIKSTLVSLDSPFSQTVEVKKVDESDTPLEGARFSVQCRPTGETREIVTDTQGKASTTFTNTLRVNEFGYISSATGATDADINNYLKSHPNIRRTKAEADQATANRMAELKNAQKVVYYVKETRAPDGYIQIDSQKIYTISGENKAVQVQLEGERRGVGAIYDSAENTTKFVNREIKTVSVAANEYFYHKVQAIKENGFYNTPFNYTDGNGNYDPEFLPGAKFEVKNEMLNGTAELIAILYNDGSYDSNHTAFTQNDSVICDIAADGTYKPLSTNTINMWSCNSCPGKAQAYYVYRVKSKEIRYLDPSVNKDGLTEEMLESAENIYWDKAKALKASRESAFEIMNAIEVKYSVQEKEAPWSVYKQGTKKKDDYKITCMDAIEKTIKDALSSRLVDNSSDANAVNEIKGYFHDECTGSNINSN